MDLAPRVRARTHAADSSSFPADPEGLTHPPARFVSQFFLPKLPSVPA